MRWWSVCKREMAVAWLSPTTYLLLAVFLLLSGYFFVAVLVNMQTSDMQPVLANEILLFLFLAPMMTMRLLAEERRLGTEELILTSPISPAQWICGKFAGALGVFGVFLLFTASYPLAVGRIGQVDFWATLIGYVGFLLVGAVLLSAGLFASSLTSSQVLAAMISFGFALILWGSAWVANSVGGPLGRFLQFISLPGQYLDFGRGVLNTSHIVYFLTLIGAFLFLTVRVLDARRWA